MLKTLPRPDVLKIDVEGAEVPVLDGATTVLSSARPRLFVEVAGENADTVERVLRSYDYLLFDGETLTRVDTSSGAPSNTVAVPQEQELSGLLRNV
jgi:hypothetical protein